MSQVGAGHRFEGHRFPREGTDEQCAHIKPRDGKRCRKWAMKGSNYCRTHGGTWKKFRGGVRIDNMSKFYRNVLRKTLTDLVEEHAGFSSSELVSLHEELALTRHAAGNAIQLYESSYDALRAEEAKGSQADKKRIASLTECTAQATALMIQALKDVEHFCSAISKIEAASKDKLNIHTLNSVVKQIIRLLYDVCGEDNIEIAKSFENLVRTQVVIPQHAIASGTVITPDTDSEVVSMDDTIPSS